MARKVKIALVALSLFSASAAITASVAWFDSTVTLNPQSNITGISEGAYFARGVGTSSDPFVINRPVHLYNLAWLQYIGYFNDANAPYYFEIDSEDDLTVLDMDGWVIPPIGTSEYPFIGNFNGNGETIANLVTDNVVDSGHIVKTPTFINPGSIDSSNHKVLKVYRKGSGDISTGTFINGSAVDVVGFFGYVGPTSGSAGTGNAINNVALDGFTVTSSSSSALGGIGIGYMNAPVSGMGISDSSISFANGTSSLSGISSNLSDYSTVGFATSNYRGSVSSQRSSAVVPSKSTASGTGNEGIETGWGGSIDFNSIFTRLGNIYNDRSQPYFRGVYADSIDETTVNTYIDNELVDTETSRGAATPTAYYDGYNANTGNFDSNLRAYDQNHDSSGRYNMLDGKVAYHEINSSSSGYGYQYLFGGNKDYPEFQKTTTVTRIHNDEYFEAGAQKNTYHVIRTSTVEQEPTGTIFYHYGKVSSANELSAGDHLLIVATPNSSDYYMMGNTTTSNGYWLTYYTMKTQAVSLEQDGSITLTSTTTEYTLGGSAGAWTLRNDSGSRYLNAATASSWFGGSSPSLELANTASGSWNITFNSGDATLHHSVGYYANLFSNGGSMEFQSAQNASGTVQIYKRVSTETEYHDVTRSYFLYNNNGTLTGNAANGSSWLDNNGVLSTGGRYLYASDATHVGLTQNSALASTWTIDEENSFVSTVVGNQTVYLNYSGGSWSLSAQRQTMTIETTSFYEGTAQTIQVNTYSIYGQRTNNQNRYGYLNASGTTIQRGTSATTKWIFYNSANKTYTPGVNNAAYLIFYQSGQTNYYLRNNNNTLALTTDATLASSWTYTNGSYYSGRYISLTDRNTPSWTLENSANATITTTQSGTATFEKNSSSIEGSTSSTLNNGTPLPETYVPLVTSGTTSFTATEKNYGYIVSGSNSVSQSGLMAQASIAASDDYGDIRVAKYPIGNIYNAVTGGASNDFGSTKSTSYCTGENLGIIGRSYRSNGYVHITDGYWDTGNQGVSLPSTKMSYEDMGLTKYRDSRGISGDESGQVTGLKKMLANQTGVYGLHYVDALVSDSNTFVADRVLINGETISNFELTRDSVDFTLHANGFINFFAHTGYYNQNGPTNNSFFDLYEIVRDTAEDSSSSSITAIKKIQTIYGKLENGFIDVSVPYVYVYDDANHTTSSNDYPTVASLTSAGYSPVFEMDWIINYASDSELSRNWYNFSIYYFEIPVNAGEFALGAVNGGQGAYLMYLDLGGNAMKYDYTNFTEYMKIVDSAYQFPLGVAIIQNSGSGSSAVIDAVDATNSVAIAILAAETVSFEKEGNVVTVDYNPAASTVNFVGVNLIMHKSGQDPPVSILAEGGVTKTTEYFRMTTVAYNVTLKRYEITEITKIVVTPSTGAATTSYTGRTKIGDADWTGMTEANAASSAAALNGNTGIANVSSNATMVKFVTEVQYSEGESLDETAIAFLLTYVEAIVGENRFQDETGYAITVTNPSSTNDLTVTVLEVLDDGEGNLTYVISINGTTITVIMQTVTVPASA